MIKKEKDAYSVILFDLSLRNGRDQNFTLGMVNNLLSVEIYNEMKEWLEKEGKIFVFVTSHQTLREEENIERLTESLSDAYFLRKVTDKREYRLACRGYDELGKPLCGDKFDFCSNARCFNKILKKIVEEDKKKLKGKEGGTVGDD